MKTTFTLVERAAILRGTVERIRALQQRYRELSAEPAADPAAVEDARIQWQSWQRELGSHWQTIGEMIAEIVPAEIQALAPRPIESVRPRLVRRGRKGA
jgi:hypothetical protein